MMSVIATPDPVGISVALSIAISVMGGALVAFAMIFLESLIKELGVNQNHNNFKVKIKGMVETTFEGIQMIGSEKMEPIELLKNRANYFRMCIVQLKDVVMAHRDYLDGYEFIELMAFLNKIKMEIDHGKYKNEILKEDYYEEKRTEFESIEWLGISIKKLDFKVRIRYTTEQYRFRDALNIRLIISLAGLIIVTLLLIYTLFHSLFNI